MFFVYCRRIHSQPLSWNNCNSVIDKQLTPGPVTPGSRQRFALLALGLNEVDDSCSYDKHKFIQRHTTVSFREIIDQALRLGTDMLVCVDVIART